MATQNELNFKQLPYGKEAALVTDLIAFPRKLLNGFKNLFVALEDAIEMRNRYMELEGLNDAALNQLGIKREAIPQIVAREAGLLGEAAETPVAHNNNDRDVRSAA